MNSGKGKSESVVGSRDKETKIAHPMIQVKKANAPAAFWMLSSMPRDPTASLMSVRREQQEKLSFGELSLADREQQTYRERLGARK